MKISAVRNQLRWHESVPFAVILLSYSYKRNLNKTASKKTKIEENE
jgi:hypothetical protein